MTIHLDWFGCTPRPQWESSIHETVEVLSLIKPLDRVSVRIEQLKDSPAFHFTLMLSMPGPDVLVHSSAPTFDQGLQQIFSKARTSLMAQVKKVRAPKASEQVRGKRQTTLPRA